MQRLGFDITLKIKKEKMKDMDNNLRAELEGAENRGMIICPICKYESKNKRGSAKVFQDEDGRKSFKCFACGVWRRV